MPPTLPLPEQLWKTASPELQAAISALVALWDQRVCEFQTRVADLEDQFKQASTRSSKTPSSDPIGLKRWPPAPRRSESRRAACALRQAMIWRRISSDKDSERGSRFSTITSNPALIIGSIRAPNCKSFMTSPWIVRIIARLIQSTP
jgi:hypothetical protein